ncbi:MAG: hypothetical protein V1820_04235 [archaeon]
MIGSQSCPICKGAGRERCPLHSKPLVAQTRRILSSGSFFGDSPPAVFIGHHGYPRVRAGVLAPPIPGRDLDNPPKWFEARLGIPEVAEKRLSLLNMTFSADVKKPALAREYLNEVTLAVKPTEVEARTGKLREGLSFDKYSSPMGPSARLEELKVTGNPKIPSKVDSIISEKLPAVSGANELFNYGFDVYYIQRLLSAGFLGSSRKLVPTRWGITATDSIVSGKVLSEIREFEKLSDRFLLFRSRHLDNEFHILLIPSEWMFEQIEGYVPGETIVSDFEFYQGRKDYASNVAGGYYAGRLAVCEYLREKKLQAGVLIVRSIGSGYFAPLGVWQVRENVRNAFLQAPEEFPDLAQALDRIFSETRLSKEAVLAKSKIISFLRNQRRLSSFFESLY